MAVNAASGKELWRTPAMLASADYVVCDGRTVYVYRPIGNVEALDATTGQRRWGVSGGYTFTGAIAVDGERIYAGGPEVLYALRND